MGNCVCVLRSTNSPPPDHQFPAGAPDHHHHTMIKVVTANGAIMELYAPITADQITSEFPGHALFRGPDPAHSGPVFHNHPLRPGHLYYLLPLSSTSSVTSDAAAPYRISVDDPRARPDPDRRNGSKSKGVWKVRLVINPEQLSEILSQDSRTEELIESVRAVAKCGGAAAGVTSSPSSTAAASWEQSSSVASSSSTCSFHWKAYVRNTTHEPKGPVDT